jgi:gliding motility-associated-like protein
VLHVKGVTGDNFLFRIYGRWGNILFETSDVNNGWDGTANGKSATIGEYVYTYSFMDNKGNTFNRHGSVTLVR